MALPSPAQLSPARHAQDPNSSKGSSQAPAAALGFSPPWKDKPWKQLLKTKQLIRVSARGQHPLSKPKPKPKPRFQPGPAVIKNELQLQEEPGITRSRISPPITSGQAQQRWMGTRKEGRKESSGAEQGAGAAHAHVPSPSASSGTTDSVSPPPPGMMFHES